MNQCELEECPGYYTNRTGGAIKVEENNPLSYCIPILDEYYDVSSSDCFFQTFDFSYASLSNVLHTLCFDNNRAVEGGADLYGGSVDNCKLSNNKLFDKQSGLVFVLITDGFRNPANISSDPLSIYTCRGDVITYYPRLYNPEPVYPGGTVEVPITARGQRGGKTMAVIQVIETSENIRLSSLEYSQNIDNTCNILKYTIHSYALGTTQELTLYAQGPCPPTWTNTLTVTVTIQECPPGFQLSINEPICICDERLQRFTNTCLLDSTTVLREHNAEFWVDYDSDNESRGLILHPHCPFDYCTSEETYLIVDNSNKQCSYNRSGLLCGRCSDNLSLVLGSSRCLQCSNFYLSLLAAFTFAGIALVLLLLVLRLTVAAGTINGLVFYANIIAVNSAILFEPQNKITNFPIELIANVLSVFIAWLNLDLGFEICFYNGMDAYVKMWMQFAFPVYIWALVGTIIVGSYYSGRVASIFGSNPIAVLAYSYCHMLNCFAQLLLHFHTHP